MEFKSQESIEWETGQQDLSYEPASPCTAPEPPEVNEMHDLMTAIAAVGKQRAMLRGILSQQILSRRGIRGSIKGLLIGSGHKNVRALLMQLRHSRPAGTEVSFSGV